MCAYVFFVLFLVTNVTFLYSENILTVMKTYLTITFNSEGVAPSKVNERLLELGLRAVRGNYDFVYEWETEPDVDTLLWLADKIHAALKGMDIFFSLETI